jgi:toxin ParE1/3/4
MSCHNLDIKLSKQARKDFVQIIQYTLENWGNLQMLSYRDIMLEGFDILSKFPNTGRKNVNFSDDYMLFPAGNHVIIYKIEKHQLYIARILHKRMNIHDVDL